MAAESLENAAKAAGHVMKVETQGSAGTTPLSRDEIAAADAVIFAHDLPVKDAARFAGKPIVDVGVKKGISDGPALIEEAALIAAQWRAHPQLAAEAMSAGPAVQGGLSTKVDNDASTLTKLRQWLMTGVSYMIPFVAAGGILIAISFMLAQVAMGEQGAIEIVKYGLTADGEFNITQNFNPLSLTSWAALCFVIGGAAFGFLVPILSGFIAFAIADRPGLVPGIVGGFIASTMGAGFLGGLVTGLLGGFVARWISGWKVHKGVRGVMPVVVIPLLSTLITAGLFITLLGRPIVALSESLTDALNSMSGTSAILLGAILGAMMGFDLGGPINKVAYAFATAGLATAGAASDSPQLKIMAAVMAAGMVAPLAMALSTTLRPQLLLGARARERQGRLAARLLVHLRGCHPVRRRRPGAHHRLVDRRLLDHRCAGDGLQPRHPGPPRRHLGAADHGQPQPDNAVPPRPGHRGGRHGRHRHHPEVPRQAPRRGRRRRHDLSTGGADGIRPVVRMPSAPRPAAPPVRLASPARSHRTTTHPRSTFMAQRTVTIASSVGLHARPAALFVEQATETGLDIEIGRPGEDAVDATSILGVMALGATHGEEVVLTAEGDGADEALDGLVALLSRDLDAE